MSAYIVDKNHIVYLVEAASSRALGGAHAGWMSWNGYGHSREYRREALDGTYEQAAKVATMLWQENAKSIEARYPKDKIDLVDYEIAPADFRRVPQSVMPLQVLKSISCLEYQSCEHEGWANSEAREFLRALTKRAISSLPGYDDAKWGAPEPYRNPRTLACA